MQSHEHEDFVRIVLAGHLLELDGEKMDVVESICLQGDISYEEFTREVIDSFLGKSNDESGAGDDPDDQDEADWWKE